MNHVQMLDPPALPALGADKPFWVPEVDLVTLPNGLTVWLVERPGWPLVTARLVVRGGRAADAPSLPGLAGLLASGFREGTLRRTAAEVHSLLQGMGGELETAAGPDTLTLGVWGLASNAGALLRMLAEVALRPAFPLAGVSRLKALALEELRAADAEPSFLAERAFARAVYGGNGFHPYAAIAPSEESIEAVSCELLRAEAARRIDAGQSLLLVVGDLEGGGGVDALRDQIQDAFAGMAGRPATPEEPKAASSPAVRERVLHVVDRPGSVQTHLLVGNLGVSRREPDAYPLSLAVSIYGGAFSSRLVTNLREEKGYSYSPWAQTNWLVRRGTVRTVAAVRNEVTGAALGEILREMDRMVLTEPTAEELERSRRREIGVKSIAVETAAGLAGELAELWLHGLTPPELGRYVGTLGGIDARAVREVSGRHLDPGCVTIVAVGENRVIRDSLGPFVTRIEEIPGDLGRKTDETN